MRKCIWPAILMCVLCGCARATPVIGPDGRQAYRVNCSGIQNTLTDCLVKAGEICGAHGYTVLDRFEDYSPSMYGGTKTMRALFIQCR
jgi:hypothetical protein